MRESRLALNATRAKNAVTGGGHAFTFVPVYRLGRDRQRRLSLEHVAIAGGVRSFSMLEVDTEESADATVVVASGEVDLSTVEVLRQHVMVCLDGDHQRPLIVDLSAITYLDASALRVLDECWAGGLRNRQPVAVVPSPIVERLLKLVDLDQKLTCVASRALALSGIRGVRPPASCLGGRG